MTTRVIPISPDDRNAVETALAGFSGPPLHTQSPQAARAGLQVRRAARSPFASETVTIADEALERDWGPMRVRRYAPRAAGPVGRLVYCHGGGWVMGRADDFDAACAALAAETGFELLSPNYRLAPEHPFPAALEDVLALVAREAACGGGPLGLVGESAGGALAASAAMVSRDRHLADIAALLLFYPLTAYPGREVVLDPARDSPLLRGGDLAWCWKHYLDRAVQPAPPYAIPAEGRLDSLPPTLVVNGERDPVAVSAAAFCARLRQAAVPVDHWICEGLPHAFCALRGSHAVRCVVSEAAAWLKAVAK